jgi:hypothetical protein
MFKKNRKNIYMFISIFYVLMHSFVTNGFLRIVQKIQKIYKKFLHRLHSFEVGYTRKKLLRRGVILVRSKGCCKRWAVKGREFTSCGIGLLVPPGVDGAKVELSLLKEASSLHDAVL